ncbi:MAG: LamG-like jellyroll fold domain-containing protein, partial [Candidatus Thorarchaeota archaeon]
MQYEKDITIQASQVVADLTDFPVLIDIFDSDLKTDVQADGDDIVFRLGDDALDFEIEAFEQDFNLTHAHLTAWVKIPNLSSTVDTVITMAYGNPSASSSSSTAVWDDYATVNHLKDDPSGTIYDSTSNNYDGTAYGTMGSEDSVPGLVGRGIDFDGSGTADMISIGQIYTDDWSEVTISIWVRSDLTKDARVFSKSPSTATTEHIVTMRVDTSNRMTARIRTDAGGTSVNSVGSFTLGSWNLLTWTWSASSGFILGYINGTQEINTARSGTTLYDSIDVFVLGNTDMTNDRYFDGILDEARLANRVLPQAWIATEFNNQIDPSSFVSVGSERTLQSTWVDDSEGRVVVSTNSAFPITTDVILTMDIEGVGQSLDVSYNPGATFYARNGTNIVDWVAYAMISPPNTTTDLNAYIDYPFTQWNPVAVANPLGQNKTFGTDWDFQDGSIIVYSSAVDYWGLWKFYFESWNYVENMQIGINGQTLGTTATFDVNDVAAFRATTPWITNARVGLSLTDPTGSEWHTDYATTGTPGTTWHVPGFQYRMQLTVAASGVDADVTNYPMLVSFSDTDFTNTAKVQADGDDFVFVQNGEILSHEIERFDQTSGTLIAWVKCNLSSTVDNTLLLYYGNPVVGSTESPWDLWGGNYDAVYHMNELVTNEGSGEAIHDSTANNYTGTHNGNSRNIGIGASYGQYFDGNDYISLSESQAFNPSGDVTISGWFYLSTAFDSSSATSRLLISKYASGDDNFHIILAGTDYTETGFSSYGALVFGFETAGSEYVKWTTRASWSSGVWHHFVCVLDSDTPSNIKIYADGIDVTSTSYSGSASYVAIPSAGDWGFGGGTMDTSEIAAGSAYFLGNIDEMRISSDQKSLGWTQVSYDNIFSSSSFITKGTEVTKTSPQLTITKTIDSTAPAGLWTATMYYNDTGSSITNATGLYEREFIVQHDTTLTLNYPTDAVSDKIAYSTAGEPIYIEYELTDDITAGGVPGATVKMNWTVSGTPTEITMDDLGDGRYGKTLDTDDLITNQQWRINIWSYHPYYNNATDYFDIDLYHATNMSYVDVVSTPVGYDFKATLVFYDSYSETPILGATITFDNGTAVSFSDEGSGRYAITISTTTLDFGDYWYRFKATKAGSFLEDAYCNVTFTLRKHYTSISVSGDLLTPAGYSTDVTVTIIDMDTGGTVGIGNVATWTFDPASYSDTTETPPGDFIVTLNTVGWAVGTDTVTLSATLSGNYYSPTDYSFDIEIRKHYTSVSVQGDFLTPHGYSTYVTVVLTDLDTGTTFSLTSNIASWTFNPASYGDTTETPPGDFDVTIDTSGWSVGTDTVTLSVTMSGIYEDPANYLFDIEIRRHYTSVSVSGDFIIPYGQMTSLVVTIIDLDTGTALGSTASVSSWTFNPATYSDTTETPPSDFAVTLNTSGWSVGTDTVTLSVTMTGIYYSPSNHQFDIEIRKHRTAVSVVGEFVTPYGASTSLTVVIRDLDNGSVLTSTSMIASWTFNPASYGDTTETPPGDFAIIL